MDMTQAVSRPGNHDNNFHQIVELLPSPRLWPRLHLIHTHASAISSLDPDFSDVEGEFWTVGVIPSPVRVCGRPPPQIDAFPEDKTKAEFSQTLTAQ
ncbi:hypothetical protein [Methylobacterium sp. CM6247]